MQLYPNSYALKTQNNENIIKKYKFVFDFEETISYNLPC